jgi:phosphoribosylanthranilate isomerase
MRAASLGADAIGLVFWSGSQRSVSIASAGAVCETLPPFMTITALMVNPTEAEVELVLRSVPVNLLQFHGDESPEFCEQWQVPYIRALRVQAGVDLAAEAARYPKARGFLLDAVHKGQFGGTGQQFDWALVPESFNRPIILAGGLNPANVGEGIRRLQPIAVDVSSGVESAPGVKDPEKMQRFIDAAKATQIGQ